MGKPGGTSSADAAERLGELEMHSLPRAQDQYRRPNLTLARDRGRKLKMAEHMHEGGTTPLKLRVAVSQIGQENASQGNFLIMCRLLAWLMLVMSGACAYNIYSNIEGANWADSIVANMTGGNRTAPPSREQTLDLYIRVEKRAYKTHSYITSLSLGAFCVENRYSSPFYCPAICDCKLNSSAVPPMVTCPDGKKEVDAITNEACPADHQKLDPAKTPFGIPEIQYYLTMVVGVVIFLIGLQYARRVQSVLEDQVSQAVVTSADFSVYVEGLPRGRHISNDEVADFFRHYGDVAAVSISVDKVGELIRKEGQLAELSAWRDELYLYVHKADTGFDRPRVVERLTTFCYRLYLSFMVGVKMRSVKVGNSKVIDKLDDRIRKMKDELRKCVEPWHDPSMKHKCTGRAVVTFNYRQHAANCLKDQEKDRLTTCLKLLPQICGPGSYTWGFLQSCCCCCVAHVPRYEAGGGMLRCYSCSGRRLLVRPAPKPEDLLWEHLDLNRWRRAFMRTASVTITLLAIGAGAVLQYLMAREKESVRMKWRSAMRANAAMRETMYNYFWMEDREDLWSQWTRVMSYISSFVIAVINIAIGMIVLTVAGWEQLPTHTKQETWLLWKLSIAYLINMVAVPLLVVRTQDWYVPTGMVEQVFYIQLYDAFLSVILNSWAPVGRILKWVLARHMRTQVMLDSMVQPLPMPLALHYAAMIKTVGMGLLYAPILPVSYFISAVGVAFTYFASKYIILRDRQAPVEMKQALVHHVQHILKLLVFVQLFLCFFVYYDRNEDAERPFFIGLVLAVTIAWLPHIPCCPAPFFPILRRQPDPGAWGISFLACRARYDALFQRERERATTALACGTSSGMLPGRSMGIPAASRDARAFLQVVRQVTEKVAKEVARDVAKEVTDMTKAEEDKEEAKEEATEEAKEEAKEDSKEVAKEVDGSLCRPVQANSGGHDDPSPAVAGHNGISSGRMGAGGHTDVQGGAPAPHVNGAQAGPRAGLGGPSHEEVPDGGGDHLSDDSSENATPATWKIRIKPYMPPFSPGMVGEHVLQQYAYRTEPWPKNPTPLWGQKKSTIPSSPKRPTSAHLADSEMPLPGIYVPNHEYLLPPYAANPLWKEEQEATVLEVIVPPLWDASPTALQPVSSPYYAHQMHGQPWEEPPEVMRMPEPNARDPFGSC